MRMIFYNGLSNTKNKIQQNEVAQSGVVREITHEKIE